MSELNTKITGLHPKVADAIAQTLNEAKARGLSVGLQAGLRTIEDQDKLYALGRTVKNPDGITKDRPMGRIVTKAQGGSSWHNYGLAADIVFKDSKGGWTWNKTEKEWTELGVIGEMFGLTWLARKKIEGLEPDYPHFQMTGLIPSVKEAKKILFEKGIDVLWSMV